MTDSLILVVSGLQPQTGEIVTNLLVNGGQMTGDFSNNTRRIYTTHSNITAERSVHLYSTYYISRDGGYRFSVD